MYLRRYYVEHLLFFMHNHSFIFLLFTAVHARRELAHEPGMAGYALILVVPLYPPLYIYRAMRRVYAQGRWVDAA